MRAAHPTRNVMAAGSQLVLGWSTDPRHTRRTRMRRVCDVALRTCPTPCSLRSASRTEAAAATEPAPNPNSYELAGRRGRRGAAHQTMWPSVDHHGQRARSFVAPNPNRWRLRINAAAPSRLGRPFRAAPGQNPSHLEQPLFVSVTPNS